MSVKPIHPVPLKGHLIDSPGSHLAPGRPKAGHIVHLREDAVSLGAESWLHPVNSCGFCKLFP